MKEIKLSATEIVDTVKQPNTIKKTMTISSCLLIASIVSACGSNDNDETSSEVSSSRSTNTSIAVEDEAIVATNDNRTQIQPISPTPSSTTITRSSSTGNGSAIAQAISNTNQNPKVIVSTTGNGLAIARITDNTGKMTTAMSLPDNNQIAIGNQSKLGTWISETKASITLRPELLLNPTEITSFSVATIRQDKETIKGNDCGSIGTEIVFENENLTSQALFNGLTNSVLSLENVTTQFTEINDTEFKVTFSRDPHLQGTTLLTKVSDSSEFNVGSLSFHSEQLEPLNAMTGVCGSILNYTDNNTNSNKALVQLPKPEIIIQAPYNEGIIRYKFEFYEKIKPRTYLIGKESDNQATTASISTSTSTSAQLKGIGGHITINKISKKSVEAEFNIMTGTESGNITGDTIRGKLSLTLE